MCLNLLEEIRAPGNPGVAVWLSASTPGLKFEIGTATGQPDATLAIETMQHVTWLKISNKICPAPLILQDSTNLSVC